MYYSELKSPSQEEKFEDNIVGKQCVRYQFWQPPCFLHEKLRKFNYPLGKYFLMKENAKYFNE